MAPSKATKRERHALYVADEIDALRLALREALEQNAEMRTLIAMLRRQIQTPPVEPDKR